MKARASMTYAQRRVVEDWMRANYEATKGLTQQARAAAYSRATGNPLSIANLRPVDAYNKAEHKLDYKGSHDSVRDIKNKNRALACELRGLCLAIGHPVSETLALLCK